MNNIVIKLKSYSPPTLDHACGQIVKALRITSSDIIGPIPLPTQKEKYTVLRSPHVHKKSREQFQYHTHRRIISIRNASTKTVDALMKLEIPSSIHINIKG